MHNSGAALVASVLTVRMCARESRERCACMHTLWYAISCAWTCSSVCWGLSSAFVGCSRLRSSVWFWASTGVAVQQYQL